MTNKTQFPADHTVARCFKIAQRAIDDLRRYMFDNTLDRRRACAERLQSEVDALAMSIGHDHKHGWPGALSQADGADASLEKLEGEASGVLTLLDASYDSTMDPVVRTAVFRSRDLIQALLEDARLGRSTVRRLESDLLAEERESLSWARRAVVDGDLGRNPPIFLVDIVEEQRARLSVLEAANDLRRG